MFYRSNRINIIRYLLILGFSLLVMHIYCQRDSSLYDFGDFGGIIHLDSIVVVASKNSFNVEEFIELVRNDESFYKAFSNIRSLSYSADNQIKMYDKKEKVKASYSSKTTQYYDGECRTMVTNQQQVEGNFYKRKMKYRYYTAKMFDHIFFTHGKVCTENTPPDYSEQLKGIDKHVLELKKLIFSPGEKADVPLIGKKTEIFSEEMSKYYNYSINAKSYKTGTECYVFEVSLKPEFVQKKKNKTVIKSLETYFEKSNFQVIARTYTLAYSSTLFDFDVSMEIELKKIGKLYVPEFIRYNGFWDVPTKKPEIAVFTAKFYDFR